MPKAGPARPASRAEHGEAHATPDCADHGGELWVCDMFGRTPVSVVVAAEGEPRGLISVMETSEPACGQCGAEIERFAPPDPLPPCPPVVVTCVPCGHPYELNLPPNVERIGE